MKPINLALKFISMSLVATILITFSFSSFAFAKTDSPELSKQQVQAKKALKDLEKIKKIDIKDEKETNKKKEFKLVIDGKENLITVDKTAGMLYVDGELAVTDIVIEETVVSEGTEEQFNGISVLSSYPTYNIGPDLGSGVWTNTKYRDGSFNIVNVSVAAVAGTLAYIFTKKPSTSALYSAAGAVLSALVLINQYSVTWKLYSFKDKYKSYYYYDQMSLFTYKGTKICQINHYWGYIS